MTKLQYLATLVIRRLYRQRNVMSYKAVAVTPPLSKCTSLTTSRGSLCGVPCSSPPQSGLVVALGIVNKELQFRPPS